MCKKHLKDKNLYTAFESISIIPVFGYKTHLSFYQQNDWAKRFFPNCNPIDKLDLPISQHHSLVKRGIEGLFGGQWGQWVNQNIRKLTVNWWRQKFRRSGFEMDYFDKDLRATTGESKYHPNDYQRHILGAYEERLKKYRLVGVEWVPLLKKIRLPALLSHTTWNPFTTIGGQRVNPFSEVERS